MEMKNSDMDLLAKHLDENTQGTLKTAKKLINGNLPKIHETFQVIYKYALTLKKMLKSILYKKNEDTREVMIVCGLSPPLREQLESSGPIWQTDEGAGSIMTPVKCTG